jgi:hypothetical protein
MAKMSEFDKAFSEARKSKGAGGTFTYNGKSYSTSYAGEKAPPSRPKNLNPQSGAAQSGTAGKVATNTTKKGIQNFDKNKAEAEARRAATQASNRPKAAAPKTTPARPTADAMAAKSMAAKNKSDLAAQTKRSITNRAAMELTTGRKGAAAQYKSGGKVGKK